MTCIHCGLCLPSCPTYLETGSEADSPRGRIAILEAMARGELPKDSHDGRKHIDRCLGCRACEAVCPSGVPFGSIIETARVVMNEARPKLQRTARAALLDSLANPARFAASVAMARLAGGVPKQIAALLAGEPDTSAESGTSVSLPRLSNAPELPAVIDPIGPRRARVGMLTGCVMRAVYGNINHDTANVLAANGCQVLVNRRQGCCGALHLHNGERSRAVQLAKALLDAFTPLDGLDAIIVNSAGCGSTMKEYGALLSDDPAYADRAAAFAAKVRDVSEFLDDLGWTAPLKSLPASVAYHDPCHLAHAQHITDAPRSLLALIPDLKLIPLAESDVCCGSAGIYNLTEPRMARRLRDRKVRHIVESGAEIVATGNPGCLSWIASGVDGKSVRVAHLITLLREAL